MKRDETPIETARRHAARCEELVVAQELLVDRLRAKGYATEEADRFLRTLRETLALMQERLRHEEEKARTE